MLDVIRIHDCNSRMGVNNIQTNEGKCGIFRVSDYLKTSSKSASTHVLKSSEESLENITKQKVIKEPIWKCRYLVTLFGFFVNFQVNFYRFNTSISIVAMVNNTAITSNSSMNMSGISCPANLEDVENNYARQMAREFDWSPDIQGLILGANFLGYVITQIPGGMMAAKLSPKIPTLIAVLIPSVCHLISPFAAWTSSYFFMTVQFISGIAQGLSQSAISVLAANWLPAHERGTLNTIIVSGFCMGAMVGGVITGAMCASVWLGWPCVYFIFGSLGIIFALVLQIFLFESPREHPRISDAELEYILSNQEIKLVKRPPIPWKKIFTSVPFYALTLARTGQFWTAIHFVSIHPTFLGTILHYPIKENGVFASVPFILQTFLAVLASWISGWLNKHEFVGVNKVRKGCNFLSCLGYSLCLLGIYFAGCDKSMSALFSILAMGSVGLSYAGCMIAAIDMSPPFAGILMGLSSVVSMLSGFVLPLLVGFLTKNEQTLEQWNLVFFISIGVAMTSGIIFVIFGSAEVQEWNFPATNDTKSYDGKNNKEKTISEISTNFNKITTHL